MANKQGFDLKVHVRDSKGRVKAENTYRLTIKAGVKEFERPPGSGKFYAENGNLLRDEGAVVMKAEEAKFDNAIIEDLKIETPQPKAFTKPSIK